MLLLPRSAPAPFSGYIPNLLPPPQIQQAITTRQPANAMNREPQAYRTQIRGRAHATRSRSRSPVHNATGRLPPRTTSPNRQRLQQEPKRTTQDWQPFQSSATSTGLHACTVCLGRFAHNVHKCKSEFLWDSKTPMSSRRNAEGHLVNSRGLQLCYDWQHPSSCSSTSKEHNHECLGCGSPNHGAQSCPRGQEA